MLSTFAPLKSASKTLPGVSDATCQEWKQSGSNQLDGMVNQPGTLRALLDVVHQELGGVAAHKQL